MASMDTPFLTIAEASRKTGRSASTIRRLIHTLTESDTHADRSAIEPSPADVAVFKAKGDTFTWRIREDIVIREFVSAPSSEKKVKSEEGKNIMDILQHELSLKNQQIEKQWEVIHALNERLREGNILMGSLQQRLALPEPSPVMTAAVDIASAKAAKKASKEPIKKAEPFSEESPTAKPSKKGLLAWLRR